MSSPEEFARRQIEKWEAESKSASEKGDYTAWQHAERELANYREMLKRWTS